MAAWRCFQQCSAIFRPENAHSMLRFLQSCRTCTESTLSLPLLFEIWGSSLRRTLALLHYNTSGLTWTQARTDDVICTAGRDCWLRQFQLSTQPDGTLNCVCISKERASVKFPWIADVKLSGLSSRLHLFFRFHLLTLFLVFFFLKKPVGFFLLANGLLLLGFEKTCFVVHETSTNRVVRILYILAVYFIFLVNQATAIISFSVLSFVRSFVFVRFFCHSNTFLDCFFYQLARIDCGGGHRSWGLFQLSS